MSHQVSLCQEAASAARRKSCAAAMIFAEYGVLPQIEAILQPIELEQGSWAIMAQGEGGEALGYIKEGIAQ